MELSCLRAHPFLICAIRLPFGAAQRPSRPFTGVIVCRRTPYFKGNSGLSPLVYAAGRTVCSPLHCYTPMAAAVRSTFSVRIVEEPYRWVANSIFSQCRTHVTAPLIAPQRSRSSGRQWLPPYVP